MKLKRRIRSRDRYIFCNMLWFPSQIPFGPRTFYYNYMTMRQRFVLNKTLRKVISQPWFKETVSYKALRAARDLLNEISELEWHDVGFYKPVLKIRKHSKYATVLTKYYRAEMTCLKGELKWD